VGDAQDGVVSMTQRIHADCPHPQCSAVLKVAHDLPDGDYPCICRSCTVRVRWATSIGGDRTPYVELASTPEEKPAKKRKGKA